MSNSSIPSGHHLAAILPQKGGPLTVTTRPTPSPGPHDLLIAVHAIALNPIDHYQRDHGFPPLAAYPSILGSDIAGTVLVAGSAVPSNAPKPGTRVAAFAPCFFVQGKPDYGALQTRVLVPAGNAVVLPEGIGWNEAATLPMAVGTVWGAWYSIGVARDTQFSREDRQGMLVWGAASSIGSAAVQVARSMGFRVYATASARHHEYLRGLGASRMFDYHDDDVVEQIVKATREDGVSVATGFDAVGQLQSCLSILSQFKPAKLASAVPLSDTSPTMDGVDVKFVQAPKDEGERNEHIRWALGVWLEEKLRTGGFVPSPKVKVVEGGLEGANAGLDELRGGVSGVKLVLEV